MMRGLHTRVGLSTPPGLGFKRCLHAPRSSTKRSGCRRSTITVKATWQNKTGSGKRKTATSPTLTPKPKSKENGSYNFDYNFELPELPSLDDVRADRVIRGSLVGTFVGTILSIVVSPVQYVLAAAAVASGVSLVPYFDTKSLKSAADSKGAELPGEAVSTIVSQGQEIAEGAKADGSAATVIASALVAGSTVSVFAAKSLPLVFGGSAIYVAAQADNNLNLGASTLRGRDFLRTRKEAGVGILFSLIALQARRAADAVTAWNERQSTLRPATVAFAEGSAGGNLKQAGSSTPSSQGRTPNVVEVKPEKLEKPAEPEKPGILTKYQIEAMQDEAENASSSILSSLEGSIEKLKSLTAKTPGDQLQGSPDDSANALTTSQGAISVNPKPPQLKDSQSFEPSLSDKVLGNKSSNPSVQFQPSLQDSVIQSGSSNPDKKQDTSPTPLEKAKGGNKDVGAGDLATGPVEKKEVEPILKPGSPATQTPGSGTPLEKVKGGNSDVKAGDLTTGKPDVVSKEDDALLKKGSPATQKSSGPASPLENLKGGNKDAGPKDLITGKTDFSKNKDGILSDQSPATQTPGKGTPLENVKGGNRDVQAGDLTTGKVNFVPNEDKSILKPDSPATKVSGETTPLENVKVGNAQAKSQDLTTGPADFKQADVTKIGSGSPSTLAPGQSTPLENVKGGNRDVGVGDLATGPSNFKAAAQQPVLEGSSPTSSAKTNSPLESLKGSSDVQPSFDDEDNKYSHRGQVVNRDNNSLLLQSSTGLGKALSLQSFSGQGSVQDPAERQELLNALARKADEENREQNVQDPTGRSIHDYTASKSVKSIVSQPYETGKTALEQALPATQAQPPKRSAQGPSEISKLARNAPPALVRPSGSVSSVQGLQKQDAGSVPALAPRANVGAPQAAPQKKQTFIGRLLVLAGAGILGSLLGVVYYLVNGQTLAHQIPRNLLTVAFSCIAAVILLVSIGKRNNQQPTAVGAA